MWQNSCNSFQRKKKIVVAYLCYTLYIWWSYMKIISFLYLKLWEYMLSSSFSFSSACFSAGSCLANAKKVISFLILCICLVCMNYRREMIIIMRWNWGHDSLAHLHTKFCLFSVSVHFKIGPAKISTKPNYERVMPVSVRGSNFACSPLQNRVHHLYIYNLMEIGRRDKVA